MYPPGQRQSITMLGRKASTTLEQSLLQSEYLEEVGQEGGETERLTRQTVRRYFQFVSLLSLVSVSANTPQTFQNYPAIKILTYIADWFCLISFTLEAVIKVKKRGLLTSETGYLRTRWGKFDIVMLALIAVSVVMHTFELFNYHNTAFNLSRSPRPFIMVRYIRTSFKFSMPKARLNQIFKRSSQQIYNVTLFFVFFWVLYGLLGVQFFGELHSHCVRNNSLVVNPEDVTVNDLTIPDTYCSIKSEPSNPYGLRCREGFRCMNLANRSNFEIGYTGFGEFATSVFTVYQAASQEGWVYIMYRATDSLDPWKSSFYFVSMIFFLAWMVKNVFIAVITETFNEIRVQFQQIWGEREHLAGSSTQQVLRGDNRKWNLVTVDEFRQKGLAPKFCHSIIKHPAFHVLVMTVTVANAIVTATISFRYTRNQKPREFFFQHQRKLEIGFVIFYNLEALFKIFCLSFRGYISRTIHKFEFLLCIMTSIHVCPGLFLTPISIFQVLRVCRLIKASPMLEDFVYKIFGPGKKLSSLVIFTIHLLLITSSIAMQLFCNLTEEKTGQFYVNFSTFPFALMSMFQILTQEAWPEVMQKTMSLSIPWITPLVAFFFIFYHLFVTLIVMSLFVAVILDNLELDEEAKKVKQLKIREDSTDVKEDLPLRLRVFEKFPERPLMAKLNKTSSDYVLPKIRESFMSKFIYQTDEFLLHNESCDTWMQPSLSDPTTLRHRKNATTSYLSNPVPMLHNKEFVKKCHVSKIIQSVRRSVRGGSQIFNKRTGTYRISENMKENGGHIGLPPPATTAKTNQESNSTNRSQNLDIKLIQAKQQQAEMRRNRKEEELRENHPYFDCPLLFVPRESRFRKVCQTIVNARYDAHLWNSQTGKERKVKLKTFHKLLGLVPYLDWTMIIITTISTIFQLFETPEYRVMTSPTLQVSDYLFVTAMAIELIIKLLAEGLVFTPKALLRDMSGILDMIIFTVNLTWLVWMPENIRQNSVAHTLMILRCFRPLRIFILVPHMRQVVAELFRGFKEIFLVAILVIALIFVFANWGVHLFGLRFAACNDLEIQNRSDCYGIYSAKVFVTKMNLPIREGMNHPALIVPRVFKNPRRFNFDNLGNAMLALFEVLSYKGWVDLRDVIIHKQGVFAGIYIHLYIFMGSMIGLTLFVGVVIANYRENKGTALLTVDQMRWSDLKKRLKIAQPLHVPPKPESNILQAGIYDIVQHEYFKNLIAFLVLGNSALLCVNWQEELKTKAFIAQLCSTLTSLFVIEICMKMIAYTPQGYFHSHRNKMDLVVTVLGVVWIILYQSFGSESEFVIVFGYTSIILRFIISVPGKHATLSMLMQTVAVSVYKSFFIIMSMFILIMCYALVGVILFGNLKHGEAINRQANFESAGRGMLLLFRIVTGEDWNRVLHDCMQKPPACHYDPQANFWQTNCGNFNWAILFFCSFYVIITYISLNLLVAIIMENFSLFYSNEEDALLSYADIRNFQITWNLVDVNQKGTIPVRRVKYILRLLKGRLEVDTQKERLLFKHMCYELERLHNGEDVTFHDVLSMLSYRSVDIRKALQIEELLAREELEYIIEEEVAKLTIRKWLDSCLKRIREKEQSLLASLKLMNEPVLNLLRPVNEDREEDTAEEVDTETVEDVISSTEARAGYGRADSVLSAADRRYLTPSGAGPSLEARERRPGSKSRLEGTEGSSSSPLTPRSSVLGVGAVSELVSPGAVGGGQQERSLTTNKYTQSVEEVKAWWRQQLLEQDQDSD